jgi:hypothetical protein
LWVEGAGGHRIPLRGRARRGTRDGQQRPSEPGSQFAEFFDGAQQDRLSCIQQGRRGLVVNLRGHEAERLDPNGEKMN